MDASSTRGALMSGLPSEGVLRERLIRLRWQLRGATMWPTFFVLTVAGALTLHWLPIAGDDQGLIAALLFIGFVNLIAVAVGAPLLGAVLRRRRQDLPRQIAADYAGTGLLCCVYILFLFGGLEHRPLVDAAQRAREAATSPRVEALLAAHAPPGYRSHLGTLETVKLETDLYRTCVRGDNPGRAFCVIVTTDAHPPGMHIDPSREPNVVDSVP